MILTFQPRYHHLRNVLYVILKIGIDFLLQIYMLHHMRNLCQSQFYIIQFAGLLMVLLKCKFYITIQIYLFVNPLTSCI